VQAHRLARGLRSHSWEVCVATRAWFGFPEYEVLEGVPIHRLWSPGKGWIGAVNFVLALFFFLIRRRHQIDIYHVHLASSPACVAACVAKLFRKKVIVKLGASRRYGDLGTSKLKWGGSFKIWALLKTVDRFVCPSEELVQEWQRQGAEGKLILIGNGIDTENYRPCSEFEKGEIRRKLGLKVDRPIVTFAGRLEPQKGVPTLLEAWPHVCRYFPMAHLYIIGDGSQKPFLQRQAKELNTHNSVYFLNELPASLVRQHLQISDVFVLPSHAEGISNVLLEAIALGIPCVSTAIGGNVDVIENGKEGILVPEEDSSALGEAILQFLKDPITRQNMAQAARQKVELKFSLSRVLKSYESLYQELTSTEKNL